MSYQVLLSLALIACLGASLRSLFPKIDIDQLRTSINTLVLYILLPALIFKTVQDAPLEAELLKVPLALSAGILVCLALAVAIINPLPIPRKTKGALILAGAFGNVTYLGLPILQGLFPEHTAQVSEVAILCEITKSPINLTLGSAIAAYYGSGDKVEWKAIGRQIATLPPIWAAIFAFAVNLWQFPVPGFLLQACDVLGGSVSALMILSLGMALKRESIPKPLWTLPPTLLKLVVFPLVVYFAAKGLDLHSPYFQAVVIEGAMPCQLLTFVIADRFDLDVQTLAFTVFLTTGLGFLTIPLVSGLL